MYRLFKHMTKWISPWWDNKVDLKVELNNVYCFMWVSLERQIKQYTAIYSWSRKFTYTLAKNISTQFFTIPEI
jgi:hypothetical protein